MSFLGWFLFFVAAAFFVIMFVPFTVRIKLHNVRDDISTVFVFKVLLFRRISLFTLQKTLEKGKEDIEDNIILKWLKKLYRFQGLPSVKQMRSASYYLLRLVSALDWHEMTVLIKVGTGDAASTGVNIGLLRSMGGVLSHILRKKWRFKKKDPLILIYPYFLEKKFKFYISTECSFGLARLLYRVLFSSQTKKEVTNRWQKNIPFRP